MMDRPQELVLGFDSAYSEAQRWIEAVTKKKFASCNFRSSLGNGVLLCDLINKIKPGTIKKLNRLSTPIAGLDNLNLFLKACAKLGLKEAQLFHPGDLQDLSTRVTVKHQESSRRLKNVLITIYWLGRKAHGDCFYNGPYLKFKAFEALLGTALYKALEDCTSSCEDSVRKRSCSDSCFPEKDELFQLRAGHKREDSLDSLNSLSSRTHSSSSDPTLKGSSEGCSSDPEAELSFTMSDNPEYRRSLIVSPKSTTSFNQFLPTRDKQSGYVPAPLRKKRSERNDDRRSWASPMFTEDDGNFSSHEKAGSNISSNSELKSQTSVPTAHQSMAYEYESSDSDADRPDPDVVQDDFASRRFHSPSPVMPTNFALPMIPLETAAIPRAAWPQVAITNAPRQTMAPLSSQSEPLQRAFRRPASTDICIYDDSGDDEDDEFGYADPVQDDLYARKVTLMHQLPATVPYDKFLPKFWTPEEDAHVRKIKLGSQRRPWYRKIQGFSRRKSGSSSEDSDGDMGPWLSVPPFTRTHSEPPSSHSHVPESRLTSSPSSQTDTATVAQQIAVLPKLEPLEFWPSPDPTSGPKLIKCEKHSLRGREHPNDPFNVSADIMPDLENDDMFARRTHAFHSSDALAEMKYGDFLLRHHSSGSAVSLVTQRRPEDEPSFPDVEKDDVVYRRIQQMNQKRPLSGAPDIYHPVPIPEPSALPPKLKAKLMCVPFEPRLRQYKPETKEEAEQHLKADDMLLRKLKALDTKGTMNLRLNSAATQQTPSGSNSCSEEDMCKWQAIREASRLRYKKKLMVERLLQKSSDSDGSKSVSDMTADQTNTPNMELRFEELQKMRELLKESEEKWQDDLTRWKNKRRSVNSDIVKKKEEREQIDQISSSVPRKSKTFKEMQDERQSREQSNYSYSLSSSTDDVFEEPSRRRTLPPRSYTVDNPYAPLDKPLPASTPALREQEPNSGSLAPVQKDFPSKRDSSSPCNIKNNTKESQKTTRNLLDDPVPDSSPGLIQPTSIMKPTSNGKPSNGNASQPSESTGNAKTVENSTGPIGSLYKPNSVNTKQPGLDHVSASLPRSNQRSDSARLTSVVTPRPFGAQASRISSLPRAFTMDESHKRSNGETDSLSKRYATEYEDISHVSNEDEEEERSEWATPSPPHVSRVSPLPKDPSPTDSAKERSYSDMRISLNQKPNSSRDFGFQTDWDSTGVRVKSVMPGSPAEIGQVKVGDEVLTVNRQQVADMSYNQWKDSMEEALQQGSLLMDIRRHGWNNWDRDLPSLPYKSHKTINLTSLDSVGSPEPYINTNLDLTSHKTMDTAVKTINVSSQPFNNDGSNRINGCIHEDVHAMNSKESESISLKNLKRRSEFFEQGGSETAISNLPVPSLSTSSTRWSWDPEEERRRQEKWQKEQERLLQEKYKKDQEKLDEEWNKVQQELVKESVRNYEEELKSLEQDKHGTLSSVRPPVFSWEEQESSRLAQQEAERKKREEERQRLEEEWRKRVEQERLEEERKREDEEKKKRQERLQLEEEDRRKRVEQVRLEEERKKKEEAERIYQEKEKKRMEEERRRLQEQDQMESFGYTNVFQDLSYSHRSFSKSTPELDEVAKPDIKGVYSRHRGMAGWLLEEELKRKKNPLVQRKLAASELELERRSILNAMKYRDPERASGGLGVSMDKKKESVAEVERQQIIQEMRKKTSLNTDNSWIRQQSTSTITAREPISLSIRRGESLDNLDMPRGSWRSSWSTTNSVSTLPDFSRPHSSLSGSSSHLPSSILQTSQSMSSLKPSPSPLPSSTPVPPRNSAVNAGLIWEVQKLELKSEYETSSFSVTPAMCDSKLGSPPLCDQAVLQQIEEEPITDKDL